MRTERIQMRVFVEGVLVPKVSSATVHTLANEEARGSFIMPSVPKFESEALKRARVHIYWSDIEIRSEREDDDWPLLFEGEITGDSFSKSAAGQRNQIYYCSGYHTYWEQLLLYYYETGSSPYHKTVWAQNLAVALGNERFEFESRVGGASLRMRLVSEIQSSRGEPYHSIVKRVFGESLDINYFFRDADSRLKLSQRFIAPDDPNLDVLIGQALLSEAVRHDVMTLSGETSMMTTLKAVLEIFRYQIINNAQPVLLREREQKRKTALEKAADEQTALDLLTKYLEEGLVDDDVIKKVVERFAEPLTAAQITNLADDVIKSLGRSDEADSRAHIVGKMTSVSNRLKTLNDPERRLKSQGLDKDDDDLLTQFMMLPDTRFALPPTCNIIFPQDQTQMGMDRNLLQEPTRAIGLPQRVQGQPFNLYLAPQELATATIPPVVIEPVNSSGFYPPVTARHRVSSPFGYRRGFLAETVKGEEKLVPNPDGKKFHHGIDLASPNSRRIDITGASVHAFDDGVVVHSHVPADRYKLVGYGIVVYINHNNGMQTRYGHMHNRKVFKGQKVRRGQIIGAIGNTGKSNGPHLHFETRVQGEAVDPAPLIAAATTEELAAGTRVAPVATTTAKSIKDMAKGKDNKFLDYKYLTPEEQNTGIVPYFDQSVIRSYAYMQFTGRESQVDQHYKNMLNSEFLWRRYSSRTMPALSLPFDPYPVAGLPALVVDKIRSIVGLISGITHTISVGGGQGVASTTVQIEAPRFWDEGDPYFWADGEDGALETVAGGAYDGRELPDPDKANFPNYYLQSLVPSNSSNTGDRWWNTGSPVVPPEHGQKTRPVDKLYASLLGPGVRGIPYQHEHLKLPTRDTTVSINKAIDGRDANIDYRNTIVGYYYHLVETDPELAEAYVKSITRRHGVSERTLMTVVLGAQTTDGGSTYRGNAFRGAYQNLVGKMNLVLASNSALKG